MLTYTLYIKKYCITHVQDNLSKYAVHCSSCFCFFFSIRNFFKSFSCYDFPIFFAKWKKKSYILVVIEMTFEG